MTYEPILHIPLTKEEIEKILAGEIYEEEAKFRLELFKVKIYVQKEEE